MENEKIVLFGAGRRKEIFIKLIEKYGGFDIVEIWDNNSRFWGNEVLVNNNNVPIRQSHKQKEYSVVISTDAYFYEIKRQLVDELDIKENLIKPSQYLFKNFKAEIIDKYKNSADKEIVEICDYLKNHELDMFNGQIKKEYPDSMFDIFRDENNGLLYSYWMYKKIYLKPDIQSEPLAKEYLCTLCKEQDEHSPHSYNMEQLSLTDQDVVIDAGAAEGFFALQIIDKVKKVYLIESDEQWLKALKYTFQPYSHKVVIVPKWLGSRNDENMISIDRINNEDNVSLVKLDIEGAESDAIAGGEKTFTSSQKMLVIACTYHATEDADKFYEYFHDKGFDTEFSKGYLFVGGLEVVKPELRKGVLIAKKNGECYGKNGE